MPLTIWYLTPGRSFTRPPRTKTIECSCKLCPSPGMYDVTSIPVVSLTLAIFLSAELGFLGVMVLTCKHTPLLWGQALSAGDFVFFFFDILPSRISCEIVGMALSFSLLFRVFGRFDQFNRAVAVESRACGDKMPHNNVFLQAKEFIFLA